jgi:predicted dehydrogenase/glycosyltransferase involved in cell wall biosynthesis
VGLLGVSRWPFRGIREAVPRVCLYTDSPHPSGVGQQILTLARTLAPTWQVLLAVRASAAGDRLLQEAQEDRLEVFRQVEPRPYQRLEAWLRTQQIDVLHVHAGIAWEGHQAVLAGRRAGVPAIVRTEHLPDVLTAADQRAAHRALVRHLDRIVCVSHESARSYLDTGIPQERIRVVRNGIEPVSGRPDRLGLPGDARLVLSVGRLTEQKGFDVLLDAAAELPETHFFVVGRGPLAKSLQAGIERGALGERVRLLGRREDVPSLLAGANLLAMPSRFEGLPIVALEAMSLGLPVVGTRVCGLTEAVVDGSTGRLVPAGDAEALACALDEVLSSPGLTAAWGEAGRRRQREKFGADRMVAETAAVYDEVLAESSERRRSAGGRTVQTRIGFVGAGVIASRHLGNLLEFPDVEVVAVADPVAERARGLAARCAARTYTDHATMLEKERLDALYICVPPYAHGAPELTAVEAAVPFFVDKPVAVNLETAEEIATALAARPGLATAVGYQWRYLDIYEHARVLLEKNPARLALGYWLDATPPPAWWVRRSFSGGQTIEQATHVLDLVRTLVGKVTKVYAAGSRVERDGFPDADIDDVSAATLHFETGAVGCISSTCLLDWPHRIGLHTVSEGMMIELAEFEIMVDVGQGRPVTQADCDPFVRADRDFVNAVQGKDDRVRVDYHEALETHRLACAVARSAAEERPVELAVETPRA